MEHEGRTPLDSARRVAVRDPAGRVDRRTAAEGLQGSRELRPSEAQEREAAWRRGAERRQQGADRRAAGGDATPELAGRAFTALAQNVRDYAIFLMNPDGVIVQWGEGARLMKRWTHDQAEGAHLRLLYPDGGSEDGTAEEHIRAAAEHGEYNGEGHRIRGDGTTFWAGVTLTALSDEQGTLLGFAKVTRDLTAQRAAGSGQALAAAAGQLAAVRAERTELHAEIEVLKEELGALDRELRDRDAHGEGRGV